MNTRSIIWVICILLVIVGVGIVKLRQPVQKSQDNPSSLSYPTSQTVTLLYHVKIMAVIGSQWN